MSGSSAASSGRFFRVRDPGGPYVQGFTEAFYAPFTAATGIEVIREVGGVEPTDLIGEMVRTRTYTWDMALISDAAHRQLAADGLLAPIDIDSPDIRTISPAHRSDYFVGNDVYATVLAINIATYRTTGPDSWADLWNVVRFPGRRALRRHPIDTLEQALLADGVDPATLYPLDLDRAFRSLDRIKPHVGEWWPRAARTVELMTSGQVDLVASSSIRVQAAIEAGAPFRVAWQGNLQSCEGWVILGGTPRADLCREFVAFVATARRQAAFTEHLCTAPTVPGAIEHMRPERARLLPSHPPHQAAAVATDSLYWSREKDRALARFDVWSPVPRT